MSLMDRLSPEQREAAEGIATMEEALAFAKDQGLELTDEELDQINGGWNKLPKRGQRKKLTCPSCHANLSVAPDETKCPGCGADIA